LSRSRKEKKVRARCKIEGERPQREGLSGHPMEKGIYNIQGAGPEKGKKGRVNVLPRSG